MSLMKLTSLLLAILPLLSAQPDHFGLPACSGELADRSYFLLCHNPSLKVPTWTGYELTPARLHGSSTRPTHFRRDAALTGPSAGDSDYTGSGFDRGHMVPAADLAFSEAAIRVTFLLSNAAPQRRSVNAGSWRRVENAVRRIASRADAVYIFTGAMVASTNPEYIGPGRVAVPTHFYKVILAVTGNKKTAYAAIVPNSDERGPTLDTLAVSVDDVESLTGLDFFSELEDSEESRIESIRQPLPPPGP